MSIIATILTIAAGLIVLCVILAVINPPSEDLSDMPYPDDDPDTS